MIRTQIHLGADEVEYLGRVARLTGASRSTRVRRALRSAFGQPTKADRLQGLEASAGSWCGRGPTGGVYVNSTGVYEDSRRDEDRFSIALGPTSQSVPA